MKSSPAACEIIREPVPREANTPRAINPPLCVDLDGTLVKTDLLFEACLLLLKTDPWALFLIPWWLVRGRAVLKREVATRVRLSPATLPYRNDVLSFLREARESGRQLLLVSATDHCFADQVAEYVGCFDAVYGSDGSVNLKGKAKAKFLEGRLGKGNFDYIGDSTSDLPVWRVASSAYVVGGRRLVQKAARAAPVRGVFNVAFPSFVAWMRSVRLLHWAKNLLVLLPVILAHATRWSAWRDSFLGFILFGCCASGVYIFNDLLDLHSDRADPSKSSRPFAACEFPLWVGVVESAFLISGSLIGALFVNPRFAAALLGYSLLTFIYSWQLKRVPLLDVFVLSSFYSIRIWAGGLISATAVSDWLLAFSMFFFLSLAMAKRHSELQRAGSLVEGGKSGRGYVTSDRELLSIFGVASSFAAVVILCLYLRSPEVNVLYGNPSQLLWLCPLVLYWLTRIWLLAGRGQLDVDPVLFAVRDRTSWVLGGLALVILAVSGLQAR